MFIQILFRQSIKCNAKQKLLWASTVKFLFIFRQVYRQIAINRSDTKCFATFFAVW